MVPPETVRSSAWKLVDGSESVKVRVEVSPASSEVMSELMAMVGLTVSTERVMELLASEPSRLKLPNEFENLPDPTDMAASVVLLGLGVKVMK